MAAVLPSDGKAGHAGRVGGLGGAGAAGDGVCDAGRCAAGSRPLRRLCRIADLRAAWDEPAAQHRAELGRCDPFCGDGRADRRWQLGSVPEPDGAARVDDRWAACARWVCALRLHRRVPRQAGTGRVHGRAGARDPGRPDLVAAWHPGRLGQLLPGLLERGLEPRQRVRLDSWVRSGLVSAHPCSAGGGTAAAGLADRGRCRGAPRPCARCPGSRCRRAREDHRRAARSERAERQLRRPRAAICGRGRPCAARLCRVDRSGAFLRRQASLRDRRQPGARGSRYVQHRVGSPSGLHDRRECFTDGDGRQCRPADSARRPRQPRARHRHARPADTVLRRPAEGNPGRGCDRGRVAAAKNGQSPSALQNRQGRLLRCGRLRRRRPRRGSTRRHPRRGRRVPCRTRLPHIPAGGSRARAIARKGDG